MAWRDICVGKYELKHLRGLQLEVPIVKRVLVISAGDPRISKLLTS